MTKALYISYNAITEPIVQSQVMPYLKRLSEKGIRFYLLTFEKKKMNNDEKTKILDTLKKQSGSGSDIEWFHLNYHKSPTIPATGFDIVNGFLRACGIIIKNKIRIVHARAVTSALIGYPAAKILGRKFIFDTRGIDSEEYVDGGSWRRGGFKHRVIRALEGMLTRSSDHVVVLTERFLKILKEKYNHRKINFSVIPCAVETDIFNINRDEGGKLADKLGIRNKFVIAYIGSLGTWYMLDEMMKFFKMFSQTVQNSHFLIVSQADKKYLLDAIKKNDIERSSITFDAAPHRLIPEYLSVCQAGIAFIKPVFSKLSSSPVKFGEYLASGLPVIINRGIGDTEEIVRQNGVGVVLNGFEEKDYGRAINELRVLFDDKGLAERCRRTAKAYLSIENAVSKYQSIYDDLAGKSLTGVSNEI